MSIIAKQKITPFQQQQIEAAKAVNTYKLSCEANIVSIFYKKPEVLYDLNIDIEKDISNNTWRVYGTIAKDLVITEEKNILDDVTVGLYLEKHPKLLAKYTEYGGYKTIVDAGQYVQEENLDGYIKELRKWNSVLSLIKRGFPVYERISDFCDMTDEQIYNEYEAFLNDTFSQVDYNIKSYNACDGLYDLIEQMDKGLGIGMPLYNANLLNREIGGFNNRGHIYGLGASSGVGKSTMILNYLLPSCIKYDEKIVIMINEEDETKVKKELLVWVANNIFKEELHKYVLRDGKFSDETWDILKKSADWIEQQKDKRLITIIPLEHYSVRIATKIIRKYSAMGVNMFVLDTLKESHDARTDEIYKSMMRDMVELYDTIKPSARNVGLFVTYQLGKASLNARYLTNNNIGQAKSIVDVMSVNLMMRRPYDDEFEGGKNELRCYKLAGKNNKSKIPFKLDRDKQYMIVFIPKNRFGATDPYQIVMECDLSVNIYQDIGICNVPQDW